MLLTTDWLFKIKIVTMQENAFGRKRNKRFFCVEHFGDIRCITI
jgi:hypothetical protein